MKKSIPSKSKKAKTQIVNGPLPALSEVLDMVPSASWSSAVVKGMSLRLAVGPVASGSSPDLKVAFVLTAVCDDGKLFDTSSVVEVASAQLGLVDPKIGEMMLSFANDLKLIAGRRIRLAKRRAAQSKKKGS